MGDFSKFLSTNFLIKEGQLICNYFGYFESIDFVVIAAVAGNFMNYLGYFLFQHLVALAAYDSQAESEERKIEKKEERQGGSGNRHDEDTLREGDVGR